MVGRNGGDLEARTPAPRLAVCGPIATTGMRAPVAASERAAEPDVSNAMSPSGAGGLSSTVR